MDHTAVYFGKMISTLLFMLVVEAIILPVFTAFFGINLLNLRLVLIVVLGTLGFAGVGTLLSAMTAQTRAREVLLPILLLPVAAPLLIFAVKATAGVLDGLPLSDIARWLQLQLAAPKHEPHIRIMQLRVPAERHFAGANLRGKRIFIKESAEWLFQKCRFVVTGKPVLISIIIKAVNGFLEDPAEQRRFYVL
mgnify:CR=1 FL=1